MQGSLDHEELTEQQGRPGLLETLALQGKRGQEDWMAFQACPDAKEKLGSLALTQYRSSPACRGRKVSLAITVPSGREGFREILVLSGCPVRLAMLVHRALRVHLAYRVTLAWTDVGASQARLVWATRE